MARVSAQKIDSVTSTGGDFLKLANDKDVQGVRFLYEDMSEIFYDTVHGIETINADGHKNYKYVDCLREENDSPDVCPLCANGHKNTAKLFLQMVTVDDNEVESQNVTIWDRGKNFYKTLETYTRNLQKRGEVNTLCGVITEIERNGAKGDMKTSYDLFNCNGEARTLDELPAQIDVRAEGIVLEKTYEELEFYVENEYFDDEEAPEEEVAPRRRGQAPKKPEAPAPTRRASAKPAPKKPVEAPTPEVQEVEEVEEVEEDLIEEELIEETPQEEVTPETTATPASRTRQSMRRRR